MVSQGGRDWEMTTTLYPTDFRPFARRSRKSCWMSSFTPDRRHKTPGHFVTSRFLQLMHIRAIRPGGRQGGSPPSVPMPHQGSGPSGHGGSESADEFSQLLSGISRGFPLEHHTVNAVPERGSRLERVPELTEQVGLRRTPFDISGASSTMRKCGDRTSKLRADRTSSSRMFRACL